MTIFKDVNEKRISAGLEEVKIIVVDIPVSLRYGSNHLELNNQFIKTNKLGLTASEYSYALKETFKASGLKTRFIKSDAIITQDNCLYTCVDNLHFTKISYNKLGNMIAKIMLSF